MIFVAEPDIGFFELSKPFDVDVVKTVDQDIRHSRVGHQNGQWTNAQRLIHQILAQPPTFVFVEWPVLVLQDRRHKVCDELCQFVVRTSEHVLFIHFVDQSFVKDSLHRLILNIRTRPRDSGSGLALKALFPDWRPFFGLQAV